MALFESYERRIDKINSVLNSYGIASIEEAEKITKDAGLDVYEPEPLCENSRQMMDMDNVVLTPHTAASTEQSVINCCTSCATDLVNVCYGRPVVCPVNKI